MSAGKFERRFAGRSNAGLRKRIRESVDATMCADVRRRAILGLADTVALTAAGRATLAAVADDYAAVVEDGNPRCDCDACYRRNVASLSLRQNAP